MSRSWVRLAASRAVVGLLIAVLAAPGAPASASPIVSDRAAGASSATPRHAPSLGRSGTAGQPTGRVIVRYQSSTTAARREAIRAAVGVKPVDRVGPLNGELLPAHGRSVDAVIAALERQPGVMYAVPERRIASHADPTDDLYPLQWGHENVGQRIPAGSGVLGVPDTDVDWLGANGLTDGSGIVVAVTDDGVDFDHPDLAGQAWVNEDEDPGDGDDDDGNGFADDVNGVDICRGDENTAAPVHRLNEDFHGTAVAGTVAAAANSEGIVGVAPGVRIMAVKFLYGTVCATDFFAAKAITYAAQNGADVINASWGGGPPDPDEDFVGDAIAAADVLIVASAGNGGGDRVGDNLDEDPVWPAAAPQPNILTVAAIDNRSRLASFSNFGRTTVDVSAPGVAVVVPTPAYDDGFDQFVEGWYYFNGTSFSAPYASGVAALVLSEEPELSPTQLRARLMNSGAPHSPTATKTVSGRLLNASNALDFSAPVAEAPIVTLRQPATLGGSTAKVRIRWKEATDDRVVTQYRLDQRVNGGPWTVVTTSSAPGYVDRDLAFGSDYQFRLRVQDAGANVVFASADPLRLLRFQESQADYHGIWTTASIPSASGGKTKYATAAGARAAFQFFGRSVGIVAPKSSDRGWAKLYVDGTLIKTISLYSSAAAARQVVHVHGFGVNGSHTIRLAVVGTAGRPRYDVDAFVVLRQLPPAP